jgi:hypothetical protein
MKDTQTSLLHKEVKDALSDKIKVGGYAISCNWNSCGFGINRGFRLIEILLVCHGGGHCDTIVVVEQKVGSGKQAFGVVPKVAGQQPVDMTKPAQSDKKVDK